MQVTATKDELAAYVRSIQEESRLIEQILFVGVPADKVGELLELATSNDQISTVKGEVLFRHYVDEDLLAHSIH